MKIVKTSMLLIGFVSLFIGVSCTKDNEKDQDNLKKDAFEYRGKYVWEFEVMGKNQVSTHIFFADKIEYKMEGKVHSANYTMKKKSYDKKMNKWIGEDESGNVYVLFFKDKTEKTVTIYKHKCREGGLKEAIDFKTPPAKTEDDYGWNEYTKK